jgi:hypothetical protein
MRSTAATVGRRETSQEEEEEEEEEEEPASVPAKGLTCVCVRM